MTEQEALRQQLTSMVEKGRRALRAAKDHLSEGDADFASSKAYYAVFHLMQAVLLTKGLTFSKHAGVISGFSEHFIKSGIFRPNSEKRFRGSERTGNSGITAISLP